MGYRALLKSYIRHLEAVTGEHFIDAAAAAETLNRRERSELRLLAAEVEREAFQRRRFDESRSDAARPDRRHDR